MHLSTPRRRPLAGCLITALCLCAFGPAAASDNSSRFCGGRATPTVPSDLSNVVGDQTLEYAVQQPASIVTCAKGYLLEKCGDHESAHLIFDKCIAAGYVGAMIWKALLLEDGAGVPQDSAKAAELLHRAAMSGDPGYSALGKMHYATALHLGRGVQKNEAEAIKWFQAAAAEGSAEAREFLKTGYHTGHRDLNTLGAGTPTAAALAPLAGDNASLARPAQAPDVSGVSAQATPARKLVEQPAPSTPLAAAPPPPLAQAQPSPPPPAGAERTTPATEVRGQKLEARTAAPASALPVAPAALGLLLLASFVVGILLQRRPGGGRPGV